MKKSVKKLEKVKKFILWLGFVWCILLGAAFAICGIWSRNVYQFCLGTLCAGLGVFNLKISRRKQDENKQRTRRP